MGTVPPGVTNMKGPILGLQDEVLNCEVTVFRRRDKPPFWVCTNEV